MGPGLFRSLNTTPLAESARHHLADAVYSLRRALGDDAIHSRGDDLVLNADLVQLDLSAFDEALAAGDLERACALYRGPFADGLFVTGAAEFDQWVERTRERYRRSYREALERLARGCASGGRVSQASEAWLSLTGDDPTDGRVVLETVRALDAAGNRAAALRQARAHVELLHREIGAEASSGILTAILELERRPGVAAPEKPSESLPKAQGAPGHSQQKRRGMVMAAVALAGLVAVAVTSGAGPDRTPSRHLGRVAERTTATATAAVAFDLGERAYQSGRHLAAADHFHRAVTLDLAFALGWYRLSQSILAADLPEPRAAAADAAGWRHAGRLPERERLLLYAWMRFREGDAETAEKRYRNLVSLYPDDLEAWLQLGETLFHYNPLRGRSIVEAAGPFQTALQLEPSNRSALWHLALLEAQAGRSNRFVILTDRLLTLGPEPAHELELRVLNAIARGDRAAEAALMPRLRQTDELRLFQIFWRAAVHLRRFDAAERIARIMSAPERPQYSRLVGYGGLAGLASARAA